MEMKKMRKNRRANKKMKKGKADGGKALKERIGNEQKIIVFFIINDRK